jgi:hypothetical protein
MMSNMIEPHCLIEVDHIPGLCQAVFVEMENDFTRVPDCFGSLPLAPVRRRRSTGTSARDFRTHRRPKCEMLHCDYCSTFILEFAMNDVVERILNAYQSMCPLDDERAADSRQKISRYIESLASAGQRDDEQLTIYGLAYLTELHEGQDPRFTGC